MQDGQKGGRSAAKALIEAVQGHVQTLISNSSPNIQYCIRVYANVAGLTKTYRDTGTISANDTLEAFMRGFNMENVLCDFVNAGNGKECVDVKIRGMHVVFIRHIPNTSKPSLTYFQRTSIVIF